MALQTNDTQNGIDNLHSGFPLLFPQRNSQDDPNGRQRQLHGPIQRSDAPHRVSKDGPGRSLVGGPWNVLRDAALRAAPQDDGGFGLTFFPSIRP
jgi:hypothetical protein